MQILVLGPHHVPEDSPLDVLAQNIGSLLAGQGHITLPYWDGDFGRIVEDAAIAANGMTIGLSGQRDPHSHLLITGKDRGNRPTIYANGHFEIMARSAHVILVTSETDRHVQALLYHAREKVKHEHIIEVRSDDSRGDLLGQLIRIQSQVR
jgi:hypothetical protein